MTQERQEAVEQLARVTERVEHWRRTRAKQRPMPAGLWGEAVSLAQQLGPYRVKKALGLNYDSLKQRLALGGGATTRRPGTELAATSFVELSGAELLGPVATGTVVEMEDAGGTRLTVRLAPGSTLDVAQLVEAFVRRQT